MRKIIITQYDQAADERVSYGGIKWLRKWDVSIQCDSLEEALSLRKSLEDEKSEVDSLKARLFEMQEAAKSLASRRWMELEHDQIHELVNEFFYKGMTPIDVHFENFARAIESKLRSKNEDRN